MDHKPKLLSLAIYSHERGQTTVSVERARKGLAWAIQTITKALQNPQSPEGKSLRSCGFVALAFHGHDTTPYVVKFHDGMVLSIADDGKSVEVFPAKPEANANEAIQYCQDCLAYVEWVEKVISAKQTSSRPPVIDNSLLCGVEDSVRTWVGYEAEQYFRDWQAATRERHAKKLAQSVQVIS